MRTLKSVGLCFVLALLCPASAWAGLIPAWVLQQHDLQATIVSSNPEEKAHLEKQGWILDGTGQMQTAAVEGSGPLHRLARVTDKGADRMLETDVAKIPVWTKAGFNDEGVVGYVAAIDGPAKIAVVQFTKSDRRLWIVGPALQIKAEQAGWTRQGTHFWLWAADEK